MTTLALPESQRSAWPWLALVLWIGFSCSAALSGLAGSPGDWYASLDKPDWTPPGWVFGPAWTALYITMGVAAWLVWRSGGWQRRRFELGLFVAQWTLNAAWTPLFFGLQRPDLAMVDIILLWLLVLATMISFFRARPLAGWLLLPYQLWLTFAAALNLAIWQLNR